ncbi:MAG: hypothetical protein ACLQAT_13555 [Candidatus Binataceae bacterium]
MLILTDIGPSNQVALLHTLENIGTRLSNYQNNNQKLSFHKTETVHYAAWMILPEVKDHQGNLVVPARLALETNYDGCLKDHLQDLVDNCRQELDEVYDGFPGYPPPGSERSSVKDFLCARYQETSCFVDRSAYYNALPGRSLADIKNALAVYHEAKSFIDSLSNTCSDPRDALIKHFSSKKAKVQPERFPITHKGIRGLFVINMAVLTLLCLVVPIVLIPWYRWWKGLTGLFALSVAVLTLPCLLPLLYLLRWLAIDVVARCFEWSEEREELFDPTRHKAEYSYLDLGRQNHLCTYTTVKPSSFRRYVIRRALWLGPVLFNYFFILGKLDQIATIHFARWTLIGQQLIFYGNYDGSWSSYLSDFSDEAWGVNMVWGNTIGFPATRFLVGRGAHNLEGFEAQAAKHYAPAPVFYSAYRNDSLANLTRYLKFRDEMLEEIGAEL